MRKEKSAIIVGAGIAGLATALRLRKQGYLVDVYEAALHPGGKLGVWESNGFRFDTGPSLFTLPELVDQTLLESGCEPRDYLKYSQHPTACAYFWEDGTSLSASGEVAAFCEEAATKLGTSPKIISSYFQEAQRKYNLTKGVFLERSLHKWQTYFTKDVVKAIPSLPGLDLFSTLHEKNVKHFGVNNTKLIQLFDRFATYNGSSPYLTPGIMQMICHLEHNLGTFYPEGGMHAIPQALYKAGLDKGIRYHFGMGVKQILLENECAIGVELADGEKQFADKIVSNVDVRTTYHKLLPQVKIPKNVAKQKPSSSAIIFYWGISKSFPQLDLHNIFFTEDYRAEFDHIFDKETIYSDPTVYVNISSKVDSSDAPQGAENWFVMVNVPADSGQDWDDNVIKVRGYILEKLSRMLCENIENLIQVENVLTPTLIEARTSSHGGALYGSSSNERMATFFRHPNFQSDISNLFFCGGSVHPGGGIPLCLYSAAITAKLLN
jgi:phytoene desaturase